MDKNLVSVIVPVFNSSKYLERCLLSIVNQSYKNIEVIVIDDGSTDNSLEIANRFLNYKNVSVTHQTNCGVASARNKGLNFAKGDYILFVDSDDFIDLEFIETLLNFALKFNSSFVAVNYNIFYGELKSAIPTYSVKQITSQDFLLQILSNSLLLAPWGKLYRKNLLLDLRFDEKMRFAEDMKFIRNILLINPTMVYADYNGYFYSQEGLSLVRSKYNVTKIDRILELKFWLNIEEDPFLILRNKISAYYVRALIDDYSLIININERFAYNLKVFIKNELVIISKSYNDKLKIDFFYKFKKYLIVMNFGFIYKFFSNSWSLFKIK